MPEYKRFVIQKHTKGSDIHWDLMIESGDVLKTWRLHTPPEEFCIGPINAEKIFDHDKKFLTYQGTVNNGTGTVQIVDSGKLQIISQKDDRIEFILDGNIVMGKFCLDYFDKKWRFANIGIFEYVESDDAIFHYTKLSIATENILPEKKLKPSVLQKTDDPREYNFNSSGMGVWGVNLEGDYSKLSERAISVIKILKSKCKLFCFCSNKQPSLILANRDKVEDTYNTSKGYAKPRMWSQYGEKHNGTCLIFSKEALERQLKDLSDTYRCSHIEYSQRKMDIRAITYDGNDLTALSQEECAKNHFVGHSEEIFLTKHIDYRDESEYRAIVFDNKETLGYLDITSSIKGIILGDKTPDSYIPSIEQLCKQLKIACRKVFWDGGVASLIYHKIV